MSAADFFASSRVLIVAGKGGVGKTTVGATVGLAAARTGSDVLLVELEGHSNLAAPFGLNQLSYLDQPIEAPAEGGHLRGRRITPDAALAEYLEAGGLRAITDRMTRSGAVEAVSTAAPGIRDLVTLGKIRQIEQAGEADLVVVDAPAAGHAVSFLRSASGLAASATSGPIRHQADLVLEMLGDPQRCQVMLVTRPEEGPVTEVVETAYSLEDQVGVSLAPVVVNGCWPEVEGLEPSGPGSVGGADPDGVLEQAARYRTGLGTSQRREIDRLVAELPLPTIELPFLFATDIDRDHLGILADTMIDRLEGGRW